MKPNKLTREEFEQSASLEIGKAVDKAKQIRDNVRLLEKVIADKEEKIRNYQNTLTEMQKELVKVQAKLYAGGTI
jgi:septal ring factor EnvC (AmiA/AmiB activator)